MNTTPNDTCTDLVSGVADLSRVPLAEIIARRSASSANKAAETDAGEFNSSI